MLRPRQREQLRDPRQRKPRRVSTFQNRRRYVRRKKRQPERVANDLWMKAGCTGEVLDGPVRAISKRLRPSMSANN
jgi:hypothetical protein